MSWIPPFVFFISLTLIADVLSKQYSLAGKWYFWILAMLGYAVGNGFWLWSIRSGSGLARGAVIYCVVTAVFTAVVGLYFYHESMNKIQIAGIILGILSLILIFWE